MSVINKSPFVGTLLATLTDEQKSSLLSLLNGSAVAAFRSLINDTYKLTNDDKGVKYITLEIENGILSGYLIYNDSYCVLIAYNNQNDQTMRMFNVGDTVTLINEPLTIGELRQVLADLMMGATIQANDVVANPSDNNGNDLAGIQIDGTKYKIPQTPVANPDGEASVNLRKLQIGDVIYQLLAFPADLELDDTKTYTVKIVNGVFTAVEDEEQQS